MQFCSEHWEKLKDGVRSRGMWPLVAKDGAAAVQRLKDELQKGSDVSDETFDPLASATWAIYGRAIQMGGIGLLASDCCPLCELNKNIQETDEKGQIPSDNWINGCLDATLEYVRERSLISTPLPPPRP